MNCENFITGYPGHEFEVRAALLEVLGQEKSDFFWDKVRLAAKVYIACPLTVSQFLEYFFGPKDAEYFASLGMNCLRLPVRADRGEKVNHRADHQVTGQLPSL